MNAPGPYGITCHRSAASMFGAARAPLVSHGERVTFTTAAEAFAHCERLNARHLSANLSYTVHDRQANGAS